MSPDSLAPEFSYASLSWFDPFNPVLVDKAKRPPSTFLTECELSWGLQVSFGLEAKILPRKINNSYFR